MPTRILQVFASLNRGGAETMLMNIYREIDTESIQFDFVVNDSAGEYDYEREVLSRGGRVFRMPRYKIYNHFAYKRAWRPLLAAHPEWGIIHGHHTSPAYAYFGAAKKLGRTTIAHSHNADAAWNIKSLTKRLLRFLLRFKTDHFFACSNKAAKSMFGKYSKNTHIINNAISPAAFAFNPEARERARREFGIEGKFVIGHVGRFSPVKNHTFLIDVFEQLCKAHPGAVLMLVGDGGLRQSIESKVKNLNLENNVIFTGVRGDVADLLQAIDVFVFPSLHEGLGIVAVEAQSAGLPCAISDTITNEVCLTNDAVQIPIDKGPGPWVQQILNFKDFERSDNSALLREKGYNITDTSQWLVNFYNKIQKEGKAK